MIGGQDSLPRPESARGGVLVLPVLRAYSLVNSIKTGQRFPGFERPKQGFLECGIAGSADGSTRTNSGSGPGHSHANSAGKRSGKRDCAIISIVRAGDSCVGSHAQKKGAIMTLNRHLVPSPTPSQLSAHRGFFGSAHFSKTNQWLSEHGETTIDWVPHLPTE